MGYCTRYELEVQVWEDHEYTDPLTAPNHDNAIAMLRAENGGAEYAIDQNGGTYDSTKWYSHEEEMAAFSIKYPGVLFKLQGQGENNTDMWVKYFYEGKMHKVPARITYDDFDEHQLEAVEE